MRTYLAFSLLLATSTVAAQGLPDIVWREIAQARSNAQGASPTVQSLASQSPPSPESPKVDRVEIAPEIVRGSVGALVCISQLDIAAYTHAGERASAVPLSIDMQQQQLRKLTFSPKPNDLCFRPREPGEYAIRFSSKLPAADGTLRGAQVFVRVS
jgi:hypothetical protein